MRVPLDAAVVAEHAEDRIAARQIGVRAVGAPERPAAASTRAACRARWCDRPGRRPARCRRCAVSRSGARRLQIGIRLQLGEDVGRGVDQRPVARVAAAHGDRGLGAGPRPQRAARARRRSCGSCSSTGESRRRRRTPARGFSRRWSQRRPAVAAETAGARQPAASPRVSAIRDVHRDFHAEAEINGLWGFPFHSQFLRGLDDWRGQLAATGISSRPDPRGESGFMKVAS